MSARSRTSTPPPVRRTTNADSLSNGLEPQLAENHRRETPRRPRCTDAYALLIFLVFSWDLMRKLHSRMEHADLRRLTHGIDFQGHVCGIHDSRPDNSFLYWCRHDVGVRWDTPICVATCPSAGDRVMCPVWQSQNDTETATENDQQEMLITTVTTQRLVPQYAEPTQQFYQYCVPKEFDPLALLDAVLGTETSWSNLILHAALNIVSLLARPYLCIVLVILAPLLGILWLILLRASLRILANILPAILSVSLIGIGSGVLLGLFVLDPLFGFQTRDMYFFIHEPVKMISSALSAAGFLSEVEADRHSLDLGYTTIDISHALEIVIGVLLLIVGLWIFPRPYRARHRGVGFAMHSIKEGCRYIFGAPWLVLVPLFELFVRLLLILVCCGCVAILASTTAVRSSPVMMLTATFAGVPRSFELSAGLVMDILHVVFTCIWMQALVSAIITYMLSHRIAKWYFGCSHRDSHSTLQAVLCQFGSFALGSLYDTCLFIPSMLSLGAGHRQCAYTDMAITSSKLSIALRNSSVVLADRRLVSSACNNLMWLLFQTSSLIFCVACGAAAHAIYPSIQDACQHEASWSTQENAMLPSFLAGFLEALARDVKEFDSPLTVASMVALLSYPIVQSCTVVANKVAEAVSYCYMWEQARSQKKNLNEQKSRAIDVQAFMDPISQEIMTDPVVAADGHSYERRSLETWMQHSDRSPLTNLPLAHQDFVPNHALRSQIEAFARDGWM